MGKRQRPTRSGHRHHRLRDQRMPGGTTQPRGPMILNRRRWGPANVRVVGGRSPFWRPHWSSPTWTAPGHPFDQWTVRWDAFTQRKRGGGVTGVPGLVIPAAMHLQSPVTSCGGGCSPHRVFGKTNPNRPSTFAVQQDTSK